jgi:KDO2-lipid IV(A) lauroyltransferase
MLWPIGAALTPLLLFFMRIIPRHALVLIARALGAAWYAWSPPDRHLGLENLGLAYGQSLSRRDKARICRASFQNVIIQMVEFFRLSHMSREARGRMLLNRKEVEEAVRPLLADGRGALILSAHLGNWELLLGYLRVFAPASMLARSQKQFDRFVVRCRDRIEVNTLHDKNVTSAGMGGMLARGELVCVIFDRNVRRAKGIIVDFLGHPAFSAYHPVNIALSGNAPVVPAFLVRERGGYRLLMEEPIKVKELATKDETYHHNVRLFLNAIEKHIRLYPHQWFWAHKRWGKPKGTLRTEENK